MPDPRALTVPLALLVCAGGLSLLAACDDASPVRFPEAIEIVDGDAQEGRVGRPLAEPVRIRVVDARGRPAPDVGVRLELPDDGSLILQPMPGAAVPTASLVVSTDRRGEVAVVWTLGTLAGPQTLSVVVTRVEPARVSALARPGDPTAFTVVAGDRQRGPLGVPFSTRLVAAAVDEFGNRVPAVPVAWTVLQGRGDLAGGAGITDALGRDSVALIPASAGELGVQAASEGLASATFTGFGQAAIADPIRDQFSTAASEGLVPPDVVELRAWPEAGELQVKLWFADFPESGGRGGDGALTGYVDFDTDQDPSTGAVPFTDRLRPGSHATGLGADFSLDLFTTAGEFRLLDASGTVVGRVPGRFAGNTVRAWIPLSLLGDDGYVDVAAVVGNVREPTDVVPDSGALAVDPPPDG